ncbi:MAG: amidohydrolase family protein [Sphingomonadaceae bacterium]|nr:amidohydrolase family protein [Sphingomonadaceae bacterium]
MSGFDTVIRNGLVIDGTGTEGSIADVGITDGRITEIGKIASRGNREIDAEGHAVTPGFVDGHTHMDAQVNWDPIGRNSCWHGVTSVVMGNCGFSVAPVRKGQEAHVVRNLERAEDISPDAMAAGMEWKWEGFDQYLDVVDTLPKGINYSAYIGHSALRTWAMGERAFEEEATDDDLKAMKGELNRALDAGAIGLSTSRARAHETSDDRPVASRLASRDEVAALVKEMKGRKGAAFELAQEMHQAGTPEYDDFQNWLSNLAIESQVMTTFGVLAPTWKRQTDMMEKVTAAGGRMAGQTHSRGITSLTSFRSAMGFDPLPVWAELRSKPLDAQLASLQDPKVREALVASVKEGNYPRTIGAEPPTPDWDKFFVYDKPLPPWRTVGEIAAERGLHPADIIIDLAIESKLDVIFMQPLTHASEDDIVAMMRHPNNAMTFSDSGAHVSQISDSSIQSYLIAHYYRQQQRLTLPECVEMITSRPARFWGFADRGVLREGNVADINIFDPETFGPKMPTVVHDLPKGARRLSQKSEGMMATIVAGETLIENGEHTGALPGKLIRRLDA